MNTKEFNDIRLEKWKKRFTDDESRIFLIVGMKENGAYTFVADESQAPLKIAEKLYELAEAVKNGWRPKVS